MCLTTMKSLSSEAISIWETFPPEQLASEAPPTPSMPSPSGREMRETSDILTVIQISNVNHLIILNIVGGFWKPVV